MKARLAASVLTLAVLSSAGCVMRKDGPEPKRYSLKTDLVPSIETIHDGAVELRITGCDSVEVRQTFWGFEHRTTTCRFTIVNGGASPYAFPRPSGSVAFEYRQESPRSCGTCFTTRIRPPVTEIHETRANSGRGPWQGLRSDETVLPPGATGDAFANDLSADKYAFPTAFLYAGQRIALTAR